MMNILTQSLENSGSLPKLTICVLLYGDYHLLAKRCIDSVVNLCQRGDYQLSVGCNTVGSATQRYVQKLFDDGIIHHLYASPTNLNKCPMMRRMFQDVRTQFIWWLDDDSYLVAPDALSKRIELVSSAPPTSALWGHQFFASHENDFNRGEDMVEFVKKSSWYAGKEPPSWNPGGKGVNNFQGKSSGDGRWFFITGGSWVVRTTAIRQLDWPPPEMIKCADDVFLSEAMRQHGFQCHDTGPMGVLINAARRRGDGEDAATMQRQFPRRS